jgi:hypothetical protein
VVNKKSNKTIIMPTKKPKIIDVLIIDFISTFAFSLDIIFSKIGVLKPNLSDSFNQKNMRIAKSIVL